MTCDLKLPPTPPLPFSSLKHRLRRCPCRPRKGSELDLPFPHCRAELLSLSWFAYSSCGVHLQQWALATVPGTVKQEYVHALPRTCGRAQQVPAVVHMFLGAPGSMWGFHAPHAITVLKKGKNKEKGRKKRFIPPLPSQPGRRDSGSCQLVLQTSSLTFGERHLAEACLESLEGV